MNNLKVVFVVMMTMAISMASSVASANQPLDHQINSLVKQTQLDKTIAEMQIIVINASMAHRMFHTEEQMRSFIDDLTSGSKFEATIQQVMMEMKDDLYRDLKLQFTAEEIDELFIYFKEAKFRKAYRAFQETYIETILGTDEIAEANMVSASQHFTTYLCQHLGLDENNLTNEEKNKVENVKVAFFYGYRHDSESEVPLSLNAETFFENWKKYKKSAVHKPKDYDMLNTILTEVVQNYPPFELSSKYKIEDNIHEDMSLSITQSGNRDYTSFLDEMMAGYNIIYDESLRPKQIMNEKLTALVYPDGKERRELIEKYLQDTHHSHRILSKKLDMSSEELKTISTEVKKSKALKKFIGFAAGNVDHIRNMFEIVNLLTMIHEEGRAQS